MRLTKYIPFEVLYKSIMKSDYYLSVISIKNKMLYEGYRFLIIILWHYSLS
jgi:hypothetical protein